MESGGSGVQSLISSSRPSGLYLRPCFKNIKKVLPRWWVSGLCRELWGRCGTDGRQVVWVLRVTTDLGFAAFLISGFSSLWAPGVVWAL